MRKIVICYLLFVIFGLAACDLQPKITSIPDDIGEFITTRYPALLADPVEQPEIYNSAATDYGVYASPEIYGGATLADDYVLYANVDDYTLPTRQSPTVFPVAQQTNDYLIVPIYNQPAKSVPAVVATATPAKSSVAEITVARGDTLYSLSRSYSIPVNDLAVMNKLSSPFILSVGQKLRVPAGVHIATATNTPKVQYGAPPPVTKPAIGQKTQVKNQQPVKISSNPATRLPAITKRTSSKFTMPVRGKIISAFGNKPNGLVNDGINISANLGAKVGAAENGVVAYAGNEVKGMGNLVIVQHSDGWMTVYAHLDKMSVRRGVKVLVGQQIGTVGQTGTVDSPQLHFEIRKGTKAYDPAGYLKK